MATFEYTPLQDIGDYESVQSGRSIRESEKIVDGSWEIRLIRLLPSKSRAAPIECELLYWTFKSVKGDYEALSYVWVDFNGIEGMHQLSSHITLNGHAFRITPNLHAALRRLRDLSHDRTLWIDQICINQADIQERNRQVDRMTLIYGYAKRTVIWLGEEACESFRAMLLLRGLARVAKEKDYEAMLAAATREFSDISRWKALGLLFKRAWWHRTWVVQECAVTKDLVVICGYRDISWKDLMSAVMVIGLLREKNLMPLCVYRVDNSSVSALHKSRLLVAARGDSTMKSASERSHFDSLLDVLTRYRSRQASNARDKVYALLRLAQDFRDIVSATSMNLIPIDYAKSVEEVYHDVARFLLTSTQRLDFLSHCRLKRNLASLPSWIPDWSDTAQTPHPLIGPYSTTGTSSAIAHITAHRLTAQALLFDRVQTTSDVCTATDFSHPSLSPTFRRWKALALDHHPRPHAQTRASSTNTNRSTSTSTSKNKSKSTSKSESKPSSAPSSPTASATPASTAQPSCPPSPPTASGPRAPPRPTAGWRRGCGSTTCWRRSTSATRCSVRVSGGGSSSRGKARWGWGLRRRRQGMCWWR